jgi:hypothetical protein
MGTIAESLLDPALPPKLDDSSPLKPTKLLHTAQDATSGSAPAGATTSSTAPLSSGIKPVRRQYHEMFWYLMWDEMPLFLRDESFRDGQEEEQIQRWIPIALDLLFDNGITFQFTTCYDNQGDKRLKRKEDSFTHMLDRSVCTWDEFQDFFEVQYYFTSVPHRVSLRTYVYQRPTDRTTAQYISTVDHLRTTLGVALKRDPGLEVLPSPKYPPGFTHTATPAERTQYFLECTGSNIQRSNLLRYTFRIKAANLPSMVVDKEGKTKPEKLLQRDAGAVLDRLQEITDSDLAVSQYKSSYNLPPITLKGGPFSKQFSKMTIGTFRRYFNRGVIPHPKKHFWADVMLAFNGDSVNFTRDSYADLERDLGGAIYQKGIQTSEYMERPYWLLYSHPDIDYSFLENELLQRTGVEIELRVQRVDDGTPKPKWDAVAVPGNKSSDTDANALLLSCGADHAQHLSLILPSLFNRDRSNESFVTHLRLVTVHGAALTDRERQYQISARLRQSAYVRHSMTFVLNTITNLDQEILGYLGPITLRKFILGLTRPSDPLDKEPLFVEVGPKLRSPGKVVLVVRPEAFPEAQPIVTGLLPMAVHYHGDAIKAAFHPTARIAMADASWDPIRRIVVSPHDQVYDDMHKEDDWMAFENLDDVALPTDSASDQRIADAIPTALPPSMEAAGRAMMGEDDAHTLGSLRDAQQNKPPPGNANQSGKPKKRPESTQVGIEHYKIALRGLFAKEGMEFNSDEESIHTSLSVRDQLLGLESMFRSFKHEVATKKDMQSSPPDKANSKQGSGENSASSSHGTTGAQNLKSAEPGGASRDAPC